MELRHFRYFLAVADHLHFGKAAEHLHMAQPPLSTQIRQLEEMLGAQLFVRSKRKVELTEAGQVFLEEAHKVMESVHRAIQGAKQASEGVRGRLRLGFASSAPFGIFPQVLRNYRQAYPNVVLELQESGSAEQLLALQERRLDFGFVRLPASATNIRVESIDREAMILALPESHPLSQHEPLRLQQFSQDRFIIFPRRDGPGIYDRILSWCQQAGFTPRIVQEVGQMHAIVGLVGAGLGVALVPESLQTVHARGVVYRHLEDEPYIEMALAYWDEPLSPLHQAFADMATGRKAPGAIPAGSNESDSADARPRS
ncbi:MAG: LysR family transcriptional regulator [Candidatus Eremiobacteraeota bacterium]|nr:LysR family transcriptional regulator [Candidatus Eremiobacteraeota bacterium]